MNADPKIWILPAGEDWIVDKMAADFQIFNGDICVQSPAEADILWLMADWRWKDVHPCHFMNSDGTKKKVVVSIHHYVPEKFDENAEKDFRLRDNLVTQYHVFNQRAINFLVERKLTTKPIVFLPYWANQNIWHKTHGKMDARRLLGLKADDFICGSFQRDTEGSGLPTIANPKLEKGPDLLCDALEKYKEIHGDKLCVLLAGWRRQYVISRLEKANIRFKYFERPPQSSLNLCYQTLDLYPVTARYEGGPQSLIECGLIGVPVVSRPVGIAEQVLPNSAINDDVTLATPAIPNVENWKIPRGFLPYREFFKQV